MSATDEWRYLLEELRVFHRNLNKDNTARRKDYNITGRKFKKANQLKTEFLVLRETFNDRKHEQNLVKEVKSYVASIDKYLEAIFVILENRLAESAAGQAQSEPQLTSENSDYSDSDCPKSKCSIMSEKFDLKTASSLLPVMDGTENTTKQLIDSIELYDSLLDDNGKKLLTTYILKTRLSQSAKVRLNKTYENNALLIVGLKTHCLTKKSASSLSVKLNNARQGEKSIDEFGKAIEELLVDLTITQADGDDNAMTVLSNVNEKIAINTFANGLLNSELRTIIKARNYSKLSEAIRGAKDEEKPRSSSHEVFHMRGNRNFQQRSDFRGNSRGRIQSNFYKTNNRQNAHTFGTRQFSNSGRGRETYSDRSNWGANRQNNFNSGRGNYHNATNYSNQRTYYMQDVGQGTINNNNNDYNSENRPSDDAFFRVPTERASN